VPALPPFAAVFLAFGVTLIGGRSLSRRREGRA
jgi:hypothetical protein